jgi:hypothetical protein
LGTTDRHLAVADTCMHIKNTNTPEIENREREREKNARERWFVRSFRSAPRLHILAPDAGPPIPDVQSKRCFKIDHFEIPVSVDVTIRKAHCSGLYFVEGASIESVEQTKAGNLEWSVLMWRYCTAVRFMNRKGSDSTIPALELRASRVSPSTSGCTCLHCRNCHSRPTNDPTKYLVISCRTFLTQTCTNLSRLLSRIIPADDGIPPLVPSLLNKQSEFVRRSFVLIR